MTHDNIVGCVTHGFCHAQNPVPGKSVQVVVQSHWMGHQFKAILQRVVMLAVEMLVLSIGDFQNLSGSCVTFTSSVNFQLYTEIAAAVAIENRVRLLVVIVNWAAVLISAIAVLSQCFITVVILVKCIYLADHQTQTVPPPDAYSDIHCSLSFLPFCFYLHKIK